MKVTMHAEMWKSANERIKESSTEERGSFSLREKVRMRGKEFADGSRFSFILARLGYVTRFSPSPRPSPLGRGRILCRLLRIPYGAS